MLQHSNWYATTTKVKYSETANISQDIYDGIKSILNNGKRTLPTGVVEHDSIKDITSITNDGVAVDKIIV